MYKTLKIRLLHHPPWRDQDLAPGAAVAPPCSAPSAGGRPLSEGEPGSARSPGLAGRTHGPERRGELAAPRRPGFPTRTVRLLGERLGGGLSGRGEPAGTSRRCAGARR